MTNTNDERDRMLEEIAHTQLGIRTLETRNADRLDFHEIAVWRLKAALAKAYEAGRERGPVPRTAPCPRCGSEVTVQQITT